tara:strand:- start:398 stop:667 length:270 start_codon:yes stop_codon:yes gene_type:complete
MKKDTTLKVILGIIALNLTLLTMDQLDLFPKSYASETSQPINSNYGLVPLNEDGTITVKLDEAAIMDINIHSFKGKDFFEAVPVFIMNK